MNIIYEPKFINSFNDIWDFISIDSKSSANKFKNELKDKIENLVHMPYKFRKSFYFENDVVDGQDRHYTNGTSFIYVSDTYKDGFLNKIPSLYGDTPNSSFGIAYSQLAFTPSDLKIKEKIIGDLPYAGVINIDFFIYKWSELFFHEYMLTVGMVGPSTKTEEFQKSFHNITGNTKPQGWDNQLQDDFL
jgi:hypothetical protein